MTYSWRKHQLAHSSVCLTTSFQFEKFSETIGSAAIQQQRNVRNGFRQFANIFTASAQSADAVWPFYTLPLFETYAEYAKKQTGAEVIVFCNVVPASERASYEEWALENYNETIVESHMLAYGTLDKFPRNDTFSPYISQISADGIIPDIERESYLASWNWSPPPFYLG